MGNQDAELLTFVRCSTTFFDHSAARSQNILVLRALIRLYLEDLIMKYVTTHSRAIVGILCLTFCMQVNLYALETGVYLDASASVSSAEEADTSLMLRADATTSLEGDVEASKNAHTYVETESISPWSKLRSLFQLGANASSSETHEKGFWADLMSFFSTNLSLEAYGSASTTQEISDQTLAHARIEDIGATHVTVSWSPSQLKTVNVYYATSTPVSVASSTLHVSSPKFWSRSQVTLKRLAPDTTYFYKVVADTDSGTTSTVEASFRTIVK